MLTAVVIMAALLTVQNWLADSAPADYFRVLTFAHLESLLPDTTKDRLKVVVMDMSGVAGGTVADPLDRKRLWQTVDKLRAASAVAVGIDNDFSPTLKGWLVKKYKPRNTDKVKDKAKNESEERQYTDPRFFAHCLEVSPDMPVFLGIYRTADNDRESWLGAPAFSSLAAYIGTVPTPDTAFAFQTRAEEKYRDNQNRRELPTMGYALARAYVQRQTGGAFPQPGSLLALFVEPVKETQQGQLLNFSKIRQMYGESVWSSDDPDNVPDIPRHYVEGSIVLLGDFDTNKDRLAGSTDSFFAPGSNRLAGVLYHASAAYTFGFEPLYEFNETTRLALDVMLGVIFLFAVWVQTKYQRQSKSSKSKWLRLADPLAFVLAGLLLLLIAASAMIFLRILWLDAAWVALGLCVHYFLPPAVKELFPQWTGGDYEEPAT
jgi:hypothetical protein